MPVRPFVIESLNETFPPKDIRGICRLTFTQLILTISRRRRGHSQDAPANQQSKSVIIRSSLHSRVSHAHPSWGLPTDLRTPGISLRLKNLKQIRHMRKRRKTLLPRCKCHIDDNRDKKTLISRPLYSSALI